MAALIAKRAALAGELEHHQAKVRQLLINLDGVDATIRLFKPDIDLEEIRPKPLLPCHAVHKGEVARMVLGTFREAKKPCLTQEFTMHVMAERGMNTADKRLVKTVSKRVGACLRHYRNKGMLRSSVGLGKHITWELVRQVVLTGVALPAGEGDS